MDHIPVIRRVLDRLFVELLYKWGYSRTHVSDSMRSCLQHMSDAYQGRNPTPIPYHFPLYRFAYVLVYMTGRVSLIKKVLACGQFWEVVKPKINNRQPINIASLGGGPGTDLIALKGYLHEFIWCKEKPVTYFFLAVDSVREWWDVWQAVDTETDMALLQGGVPTALGRANFLAVDLAFFSEAAPPIFDLRWKDVYIMSYVISEIADMKRFAELVRMLAFDAPLGAVFLIVDINMSAVMENARRVLESANLKVLDPRIVSEELVQPSEAQQMEYYLKEWDWNMHRRYDAFWIVGVKQ